MDLMSLLLLLFCQHEGGNGQTASFRELVQVCAPGAYVHQMQHNLNTLRFMSHNLKRAWLPQIQGAPEGGPWC